MSQPGWWLDLDGPFPYDNEKNSSASAWGQVLRYRHQLERIDHQRVTAVLVP